jgi:hypothetical protein
VVVGPRGHIRIVSDVYILFQNVQISETLRLPCGLKYKFFLLGARVTFVSLVADLLHWGYIL